MKSDRASPPTPSLLSTRYRGPFRGPEEGQVSQRRKSTTALTGLIVAAVIAGAYLMGRSDERAGRPFSLANPAQAADQAAAIGSNSIVPERTDQTGIPPCRS